MGGDLEGMTLDPPQHRLREYDVLACRGRDLGEREVDVPHRTEPHVEHVSAVHVQTVAKLVELRVDRLSRVDGKPGDLDQEAVLVLHRPYHHHDVLAAGVGHQQCGEHDAGEGRTRSVGQVHQRGSRQPKRRYAPRRRRAAAESPCRGVAGW